MVELFLKPLEPVTLQHLNGALPHGRLTAVHHLQRPRRTRALNVVWYLNGKA